MGHVIRAVASRTSELPVGAVMSGQHEPPGESPCAIGRSTLRSARSVIDDRRSALASAAAAIVHAMAHLDLGGRGSCPQQAEAMLRLHVDTARSALDSAVTQLRALHGGVVVGAGSVGLGRAGAPPSPPDSDPRY